jgi:hypothetical protein
MQLHSKARAVGEIVFPGFTGAHVYMARNLVGHPLQGVPDEYQGIVSNMLQQAGIPEHTGFYVTIDEQFLKKDAKLRRGGVHIDGNYLFSWGSSGGWLNGTPGRMLTEDQHRLQYQSELGGVIMASSFVACEAFLGTIDGTAGHGGDCEHLRSELSKMESFWLKENVVYLGNSTFVHEGHVVSQDTNRQLVRITLDTTFQYK